jgi:alpha-galactosidase
MKYTAKGVEEIKIAYVGGGSRGWAWGLMSDLASAGDIHGEVALYDIDYEAAKHNEIIGNMYNGIEGAKSTWNYKAVETLEDALTGADFVVISILPGTFDEMESDVHTPEKYGIYQSVGDTVGPGGIIRALRTLPMIEVIAKGIEKCCPKAWVINYTNPMTVITRMLYKVFPGIKAFGCCHEVFGTQSLLATMLIEEHGYEGPIARQDIKVNVTGINHFTWLTEAKYRDVDLFPIYKEFAKKYAEVGYVKGKDDNWLNNFFDSAQKVKFDLFNRYGYIAAAGDRHLAEFSDGEWYLKNPETVKNWLFGLTPVSWRKEDLKRRLQRSEDLRSGKEQVKIGKTGEDGVNQIRALLGLHEIVTNVNLPNKGQIPNLPYDAVVETNATFRSDSVDPVCAGNVPSEIYCLIARTVANQETVVEAAYTRNLDLAFNAFINDPLVTLGVEDSRKLFDEMVENTKDYLKDYFV